MTSISWPRVFRIVWRINGLALLLLLLLAVVGLGGTLVSGLFRMSHASQAPQPNVAPAEEGQPELRLGAFERILGSTVLRADLHSPERDSFSSYKGGSSVSHNVLFYDTQDGKSWWLLPDSESRIASEETVALPGQGMDAPLAKVFLVSDPARADADSLMLTDLKGLKRVPLAQGNLRLDEVLCFSKDDAKVLYHDPAGYHLVTVNPTDIAKVREAPVTFAFPPRK
jgi:hypothetical protein